MGLTMLFDTHTHLDDARYNEDREAMIARARKPVSKPSSPSAAIWRPARRRSHWRSNTRSSMPPSASIRMK